MTALFIGNEVSTCKKKGRNRIGGIGWRKTTTILYIFRWEKFPDYDVA